MELSVHWSKLAETKLLENHAFLIIVAGNQSAIKLISNIINSTEILKKSPRIGQLEPLLKNRHHSFRYLIYGNYKIIYLIDSNKNQIKIANVFDCRQNPIKIEETK